MRQSGILAAAGLFALENNVDRLAIDHANARRLAAGLSTVPGITIDRDHVETNIFFTDVGDITGASEFVARSTSAAFGSTHPLSDGESFALSRIWASRRHRSMRRSRRSGTSGRDRAAQDSDHHGVSRLRIQYPAMRALCLPR